MNGIMIEPRAAAVAVLMLLVGHGAAEAQSLGRIGRAVKDRIGAQAPASQPATPSAGNRGAGFTEEQLDGLAAGLVVEGERRRALAAELAALEPRPDFEQCRLQFGMSAAGTQAFAAYSAAVSEYYADPQNTKKQQAMEAAQAEFEEVFRKACGPSPDDAPRLREQRQAEPERAGAQRAGVSAVQYARLKELVLPFCVAADGFDAGQEARIPSGAGASFSYSADDTALLKPRCARLLPLVQATL